MYLNYQYSGFKKWNLFFFCIKYDGDILQPFLAQVWGQAHLQAAYAIMQVFMESDPNAVKIHTFNREDRHLDIQASTSQFGGR